MKKILITENFYQYQFPPPPNMHFGFNIYVLTAGREALFIDAGFEDHALAVKEDLAAAGIEPKQVIISHFHNDHIEGLRALPKLRVFGSKGYQTTLDDNVRKEDQQPFLPTDVVTGPTLLEFGNFSLRLLLMPGHAACGLHTIIDNRFIHIGDDLLCSNDGIPLLPSVTFDRIPDHITALEKLRDHRSLTILPGHGGPISGEANVVEAIDNRLRYLRAVFQSRSRITYEEATKECTCDFLHKEWHENLYK